MSLFMISLSVMDLSMMQPIYNALVYGAPPVVFLFIMPVYMKPAYKMPIWEAIFFKKLLWENKCKNGIKYVHNIVLPSLLLISLSFSSSQTKTQYTLSTYSSLSTPPALILLFFILFLKIYYASLWFPSPSFTEVH